MPNYYFTSYHLSDTGADTEDMTNGETKVYSAIESFRFEDEDEYEFEEIFSILSGAKCTCVSQRHFSGKT